MIRFQNLILFLLITINTVNPSIVYGQKEKSERPCLQSKIKFDDSSIEKLVLHPEDVLADPNLFWESDSAYRLVKLWHQWVSLPIQMDKWKGWVQELKNRSADQREKNTQLIAVKSMIKKEKEFNDKAIPYICSFLPKDCPDISTTIYFTTAIMANGFQMGNDIVIYGENADKDNLLIHELFHKGQRACKSMIDENESKDSAMDQFYINLLIEGTATYVAYNALKEFPNVDPLIRNDYRLLQDANALNRLLKKLNETLKNAPSSVAAEAGQKEFMASLWQVGSTDRAFYVVGWYMAKTIDEKLGRDALAGTISKGPRSFLRTYNSLVDEKLRVLDLYTQK
jgi:hypothetical protein